MKNFALIGAAGFVAPRHLQAIKDTGNRLVAAIDPNDSVGVLDHFFPDCKFFTEIERFDRHLEKLKRLGVADKVEYISICSPNYLHDAHIRLALRLHANAICEKPLVLNPWNVDALQEIEAESPGRIFNILQLRLIPGMRALQEKLAKESPRRRRQINLTYLTRRGPWYQTSWKGQEEKSGGLITNIGIHFFDLLIWLFGAVEGHEVYTRQVDKCSGIMHLEWADVRWFLSVDGQDLPEDVVKTGNWAYRSLTMDGEEIELSHKFHDLHTLTYEEILAGRGFGLAESMPAIQAAHDVRKAELSAVPSPLGLRKGA